MRVKKHFWPEHSFPRKHSSSQRECRWQALEATSLRVSAKWVQNSCFHSCCQKRVQGLHIPPISQPCNVSCRWGFIHLSIEWIKKAFRLPRWDQPVMTLLVNKSQTVCRVRTCMTARGLDWELHRRPSVWLRKFIPAILLYLQQLPIGSTVNAAPTKTLWKVLGTRDIS